MDDLVRAHLDHFDGYEDWCDMQDEKLKARYAPEIPVPDEHASDEQLVEYARQTLNLLYDIKHPSRKHAVDDALNAIERRLSQRAGETLNAQDALAHARELSDRAVNAQMELRSFLKHWRGHA